MNSQCLNILLLKSLFYLLYNYFLYLLTDFIVDLLLTDFTFN